MEIDDEEAEAVLDEEDDPLLDEQEDGDPPAGPDPSVARRQRLLRP